MKHLLIICSLLALGLNTSAFAQEQAESSQESKIQEVKDLDGGIKISIGSDDDFDADQKIKKVVDIVGEFDSEIARELEAELSSLSEDDKAKLVDKLDNGFTFNPDMDGIPSGAVAISIIAIVMVFGLPLFIVIALLTAGHRKRKQKMALVDLYIKSDRDIPEHVMTGLDNGGSASSLKSGLTLTAVGIGIVAAFSAVGSDDVAGFGLIPMFLGIARLVFWFLVERKTEPQEETKSDLEL